MRNKHETILEENPASPLSPPIIREVSIQEPVEKREEREIFKDITSFFVGIQRESGISPSFQEKKLVPALVANYLDLTQIRHDYPLCILENSPEIALPVSNIFDRLIEDIGTESDAERRLKVYLLKLESLIKSLVDSNKNKTFFSLWQEALSQLSSHLDKEQEKDQRLLEDLEAITQEVQKFEGEVVSFDQDLPVRLMRAIYRSLLKEKFQQFEEGVSLLTVYLENLLEVDEAKGEEGYSPEKLAKALAGQQELDTSKLAEIIPTSHKEGRLSSKRRERIEKVLEELKSFGSLYEEVDEFFFTEGVESALSKIQEKKTKFLEFIKAVRIANLEISDKYEEDIHDPFFSRFDWNYVTKEELSWLIPTTLLVETAKLSETEHSKLLELLTWKFPIKVVLVSHDLNSSPNWIQDIAKMSLLSPYLFVFQGSMVEITTFIKEAKQGMEYEGAAIFHLYAADSSNIPSYLLTASAHESRALPYFISNPMQGKSWVERFSIQHTPQCEHDWPTSTLVYQNKEEQESTLSLPFTYADYLAMDPRFSSSFMWIPPEMWHPNMIPLHEYLQIPLSESKNKIPYILMVDQEMWLHRVVVNREIVDKTLECLDSWHTLQELAGINNSHVAKEIAKEKERLEQEKQEEIAQLESQHQEEIEKRVAQATEAVIDKIAAGLLGLSSSSSLGVSFPLASTGEKQIETSPAEQAEEEEEEKVEEEEEEEAITFDEPYIETPRCTTCNECINLNKQMFAYNENKQAYIKDPKAGTFRQLVEAAEKCPARIIHPGKPLNPDEEGLEELIKRAEPFNQG